MNQLPILYTFIRCPWAMRARLALTYMKIDYETREVDLKNKPQSMLEFSPKGTVPVLILTDGKILEESLDIILWAMPKPNATDQAAIDEIISSNDNTFKVNSHYYKYPEKIVEAGRSQEYYRAECEKYIQFLDQKLSKHQYLISDEISIADLAVFPLVRQFSIVDSDWFVQTSYQNVLRWLVDIGSSEFYEKAMRKFPLYQDTEV